MSARAFIISFILLFSPLFIYAQDVYFSNERYRGIPFIKNYTVDDYQSEAQNWAVIQDDSGIMFFGNNKGILEYDGVNWRLIQLPNKSVVRSFYKDTEGKIYVGGNGDFGYMDKDSLGGNRFVSLLGLVPEKDRIFADVWNIFVLSEKIYFSTITGIYVLADGAISVIRPSGERSFHTPFFVNGRAFVRESGAGLMEIKPTGMGMVPDGAMFATERIYGLQPYATDTILVFSRTKGFYFMTDLGITKAKGFASEEILMKAQTYRTVQLKNGNYAVATQQDGLFIIDHYGNILLNINRSKGLPDNAVYALMQDKAENLWLCLENGISYIEINSPFHVFDERTGLLGTTSYLLRQKDRVFAGSSAGVFIMDWNKSFFEEIEGARSFITNMLSLPDQDILVSYLGGIYHFRDGKLIKNFTAVNPSELVIAKNQKEKGLRLLAGLRDGMALLEKNGAEISLSNKVLGFKEDASTVIEDKAGNIWALQPGGNLFRLRADKNYEQLNETEICGEKHGLPKNGVLAFFEYGDKLFFSTEKGAYYYDAAQKKFLKDKALDQILGIYKDEQVDRIVEDPRGNIWLITNQRVVFYESKRDGTFQIKEDAFNKLSKIANVVPVSETEVFFLVQGPYMIYYNFKMAGGHESDFKVYIRKVEEDNSGEHRFYNIAQKEGEYLVLPYSSNSVRIGYAASFYVDNHKTLYQFKLEGFDEDWSEWTNKTEKEYTNLPEGTYTFKVKAKNIFGVESDVCTYYITILPPWYRTWWAYTILVFAIAGLVVLLSRFNTQRIRVQREKLKAEVDRKTAELQEQSKKLATQAEDLQKAQTRIQIALDAEREKTEMLQAQEEEMRQNVEELLATQEGMRRMQLELQQKNAVFETSRDANLVLDSERIIACNEAAVSLFGYQYKDEIIGKNLLDFSPETQQNGKNSSELIQLRYHKAFEKGANFFEWTHKNMDGDIFDAEILLSTFHFEGKDLISATIRDITERKVQEKELSNSYDLIQKQRVEIEKSLHEQTLKNEQLEAQEEEMRQNMEELLLTQEQMTKTQYELEGQLTAINNSSIIKAEFDLRGKLISANDAFYKIYHYDRNDSLEIYHQMLLNAEYANSYEYEFFWDNLKKGSIEPGEYKRYSKEGDEYWINCIYTSVKNNKGEVYKIIKLGVDVTESKKMTEELKEQAEILLAQEEEMRQNMEELITTQEAMQEKQKELQKSQIEIEAQNNKLKSNESILKKAYDKMREQEVAIRQSYEELQSQEEELRQNMEELQTTQEALREKSENLESKNRLITASIRYAQNIQQAILPSQEDISKLFSECFILFRPKDIVSGDFYWYSHQHQKTFLAVVDCTGHGVPGAFMSMIGNSLLNEIVNTSHISNPAVILELLHVGIRSRLKQDETDNHDGMDIALCMIEEEKADNTVKVTFAGAKRPLYYIQGDEPLKILEGERKSIGGWQQEVKRIFENQHIVLNKGDLIYLSSDGVIDNPNMNRKKFGEKRFIQLLEENKNQPLETQKMILEEALNNHQGKSEQRDDITIIGLKL